ncbi:exporter-like protein [Sulfurospirillum deleyianum]|uniref:Exporter-like protein n=1 Tax=Sulfurospirillum deleyianum (strain ATCC 51133 / DSM 6946 / 5175) TaxID=525898 RepID=D1B4U6_SULD5|nr:exporter-like protein [Sulfurospirillum deleyianum]ACZ13116.1 exporter-like protein [Sulfurospirillum deleyianum DSM 6946]
MKLATKSLNFFLFGLIGTLFFLFYPKLTLSTNLLSFVPDGKEKQTFERYGDFKQANHIFIAIKGFDQDALATIKSIEQTLVQSGMFKHESAIAPNPKLLEYTKTYAYYLSTLQTPNERIDARLKRLYEDLLHSPYYLSIDTQDPLGYFQSPKKELPLTLKEGHAALEDYGYLSIFSLSETHPTLESYQTLYTFLHKNLDNIENVRLFSPFFYFVENAKKIESDVTFLIFLSTTLLLLLYLFIIKNIALLLNTILTLISSALLALMLTNLMWQEVSIFVLAFGNAIGTLAIDYMFHYYFYGHYESTQPFNRSVFYGFLTTFGGFLIFSWVDFPLIQQVCFFAMASLLFSYLQFVFLFPRIGFKKIPSPVRFTFSIPLPYRLISLLSLLIILGTIPFVRFDTSLKNLDYQNTALMQEEAFFKGAIGKESLTPILLQAPSIEGLIERSKELSKKLPHAFIPLASSLDEESFFVRKKELSALKLEEKRLEIETKATSLGFRKAFFYNAYTPQMLYPPYPQQSLESLNALGFDVIEHDGVFYTHGMIHTEQRALLKAFDFALIIDAKEIFFNALQTIKHQLLLGGGLALGFVALTLLLLCYHTLSLSASFVLLPSALILSLCTFTDISIAHLFMLFIMMLFGIDYGIYMRHETNPQDGTRSAIFFSIIDTFAGFGVLIFSHIGALHDIGMVSTLATIAILFLLIGREKQ